MKDIFDENFSRLHTFDWDKAKIFYYVAKLGSFSEAAKFLNASQPNLSRQVSLLEEDLQCRLLNRSVRGVMLTRKGSELFAIVENYYLALKSFNYNHKVMSQDGERRKIRISASHILTSYILQNPILNFNQEHPEIMIEMVIDETDIDLALSDVDLAIRPYNANAKNINQEPILRLRQQLYASQAYLIKMGMPKTVDDLCDHHFLAYAPADEVAHLINSNWILQLGMMTGGMREPSVSSNSLEFLVESAKRGFGIIASYKEISLIKDSGLQPILLNLTGPEIHEYIVYPSYLKKDSVFMEFVNHLKTQLQQQD